MEHGLLRFAHEAMATTFEVVAVGEEARYAQQAADAAFSEVDAIERALSRYQESSDIAQINRAAPDSWVKVSVYAVECLSIAVEVARDTNGAFDPTIGPLMACWRGSDGTPQEPSPEDLAAARSRVGVDLIELDKTRLRVRVKRAGVSLDLGGVGKGYALDKIGVLLAEWDIENVLVQSGGSTVLARGSGPEGKGWSVGVGGSGDNPTPLGRVYLRDAALSGSGVQVRGRHIMDPRVGRPAMHRVDAWSYCKTAGVADALSTAFMVMVPDEVRAYCRAHRGTMAMLLSSKDASPVLIGDWPLEAAEPDDSR